MYLQKNVFRSIRLAVGPTQPPIQWLPGALYPGVKRSKECMEIYLHYHIRLHGVSTGQLYLVKCRMQWKSHTVTLVSCKVQYRILLRVGLKRCKSKLV